MIKDAPMEPRIWWIYVRVSSSIEKACKRLSLRRFPKWSSTRQVCLWTSQRFHAKDIISGKGFNSRKGYGVSTHHGSSRQGRDDNAGTETKCECSIQASRKEETRYKNGSRTEPEKKEGLREAMLPLWKKMTRTAQLQIQRSRMLLLWKDEPCF